MSLKKFLKGILILATTAISIAALALTAYVASLAKGLPEINPQDFNIQLTSTFYDNQGQQVANRYYTENRVWTDFDKMPQTYINAVVAIEDKNFWTHQGIDILGIARALVSNYISQNIESGASTITQQLSRNVLIEADERYQQTSARKIKEILISL